MQSLKQRVWPTSTSAQAISSEYASYRPLNWVLPGKLAIGDLPQKGDSIVLAQEGIKVVLSLCAMAEGILPRDVMQTFRCLRYILPDSQYFLKLQANQLERVVEIIDDHIFRQQPILVHCRSGVERSPIAAIAYLCLHQSFDVPQALAWVKQVQPLAQPTEAQLEVVQELVRRAEAELDTPTDSDPTAPLPS